jgi:hypothetical protein
MFHVYILFLALSGAAMLVMTVLWPGALGRRGRSNGARIFSGVYGAGLIGYAIYLQFFFHGGHYVILIYVFLLPILMVVRYFRSRQAVAAAKAAPVNYGGFGEGPSSPPGAG